MREVCEDTTLRFVHILPKGAWPVVGCLALVGCSGGGGGDLTAEDYAAVACTEWRSYVASASSGQADTSKLPLVADDAELASELSSRYNGLESAMLAALTEAEAQQPVDATRLRAVEMACDGLGEEG